jgi:hypothetical protein
VRALPAALLVAAVTASCTGQAPDTGPTTSPSPGSPAPSLSVPDTEMGAAFQELYQALADAGWQGDDDSISCVDVKSCGDENAPWGHVEYVWTGDRIRFSLEDQKSVDAVAGPLRQALGGKNGRLTVEVTASSYGDPEEIAGIVDVLTETDFSTLDLRTDAVHNPATGASVFSIPGLATLHAGRVEEEAWPDRPVGGLTDLKYSGLFDFALLASLFPNLESLVIDQTYYREDFAWADNAELHLESLAEFGHLDWLTVGRTSTDPEVGYGCASIGALSALVLKRIQWLRPPIQRLNGQDLDDFKVADLVCEDDLGDFRYDWLSELSALFDTAPSADSAPTLDGPMFIRAESDGMLPKGGRNLVLDRGRAGRPPVGLA